VAVDDRPTWQQARQLSYQHGERLRDETLSLHEASGRRLARDVVALCDLPHYESSAMDGWAVAGDGPWTVIARHSGESLAIGQTASIVTGAIVPPGTTAILRNEHARRYTDRSRQLLATTSAARVDEPSPGEHIRTAGTEAMAGVTLIPAGRILNPAHIALAAAAGYDELTVSARPRVSLVLTGDEVVLSGVPDPGRVRDSFGPVLPAVLTGLGAQTVGAVHLQDSLEALIDAIRAGTGSSDVIVTTGGTGNSDADHLRAALRQLGATVLIGGIRMRPGAPSMLARLPDGRYVIGLPGNPLAAIVGLLTLAEPLFAVLTGGPEPATNTVVSGSELTGRAGTSLLVPYQIQDGVAIPTHWRASTMMRGLASSDGILVCPPHAVAAGETVAALRLPWNTDDAGGQTPQSLQQGRTD